MVDDAVRSAIKIHLMGDGLGLWTPCDMDARAVFAFRPPNYRQMMHATIAKSFEQYHINFIWYYSTRLTAVSFQIFVSRCPLPLVPTTTQHTRYGTKTHQAVANV